MLYSCTHMATVGVKGLTKEEWEEECKNVEKKQFAAYNPTSTVM